MFEELTAFIPKLTDIEYGHWHIDKKGDGSPETPFQMPFVVYDEYVHAFSKAVTGFAIKNKDLGLTDYMRIIEPFREDGKEIDLASLDVSKLDGITTAALIVAIVRQERFCDGLLLDSLKNGAVQRLLKHLKKIDDKN